jgi:hypothetical protein
MTRSRSILRNLSFLFLFAVLAAPAGAQYIYGVTALQLDPDVGYASGYSATELDYYACYYYDAAVAGALYEDGVTIDSGAYHGVCAARVYTSGFLRDDRYYTQHTDHYVIAYYYDYYYGYYDPYGYGYAGPYDYGGGFNYYGNYGPYYFAQSTYYIGWTRVTLFNPGPCSKAPTFSGPSTVTRGNTATYTLTNVCSTATVKWAFSEGGNTTVTRTGGTNWSGPMVTSGTVSVRVDQGGQTYNFSKAVTVNARSSFAFPAVAPTQKANNSLICEDKVLQVPDPPTAQNNELGMFLLCIRYSWVSQPVGSGPNQGYRYLSAVSDSKSDAVPPQTTFAWTITPQLDDPSSDFYRAQCGRDGYISGAQLRANTITHESGTRNSHYSRYVAAQNNPANNIKTGLEGIVARPGETEDSLKTRIATAAKPRIDNIIAAAQQEPCGVSDVTLDENCQDHGAINFMPYKPCSPFGLNGQVVNPSRIDLSWTDGSFNETGFRIERRDDPGSAFSVLATTGPGVTSFTDTSVSVSRAYVYRVFALTASDTSPSSNEVRVFIPSAPPSPPSNLSGGAVSATQVDLAWNRGSSDEEGFRIERSDNGSVFVEIASVGAGVTSYSDTSVLPNTTYNYQVFAWNALGSSPPSSQITVTTLNDSPPAAPCCLRAENIYGGGAITFFWTDMSDNEDGFTLERSDSWEGEFVAIGSTLPNQTSFTDYGLKTGQLYRYRVVAVNAYGQSYSEEMYFSPTEH